MSSFVILAYMYVVRTFVRQIKNLSLVGLFICVTCPFACLRNESFGTYTHFPDILYQNKKKNEIVEEDKVLSNNQKKLEFTQAFFIPLVMSI